MIRIGAFVSHPIQYQAPLFRYISDQQDVDLTVYFGSKRGYEEYEDEEFGEKITWDVPLVQGYNHQFLNNALPVHGNSILRFNPSIRRVLASGEIDAFWVHGIGAVANWFAIVAASTYDIPVIYRAETTPYDNPSVYRRLREVTNNMLFDQIDAFAYIGEQNRQYYYNHGVEDKQLFHAPYTVPNGFFQEARAELPEETILLENEGFDENKPIVAFVGKLIKRKQPGQLLNAFVRATDPGEATLLFVGDGKQRHKLETKADKLARRDDIRFTGFVNQQELPRFYEIADVFVLPSAEPTGSRSRRENWGLVVNEAMNFDLPIVVSDAVGCAPDLVDETTGRVYPSESTGHLSDIISKLVRDDHLRARLGRNAAEKIRMFGIPETASGVINAARFVTE